MNPQSARSLLMIYPSSFGFDEQTAATNAFQRHLNVDISEMRERAAQEFEAFVAKLRRHDIDVTVFTDRSNVQKPSAVFTNNWLTTWPDGRVYLYPMATESRRVERKPAALDRLRERFTIGSVTDLSDTEEAGLHLESTGVIIFDHINRIAYGCASERCDEQLFLEHIGHLGYEPVYFYGYDTHGTAVYHTNVMMGIQTSTAVICSEAITNPKQRLRVLERLKDTGREVVEISQEQMASFCGNVLEVQNTSGQKFLILSQNAYDAFTPEQRTALSKDKKLLPIAIPTIETVGGGSVRCMMAEVFLPPRSQKLPHHNK